MRRLVATCLTAAVLTGCATSNATDPLQVTDDLRAAEPARSPAPGQAPAGRVLPAAAAQHTSYDPATGTLTVATGRTLALYDTAALGTPPRTLELPGEPATLSPSSRDGHLLAPVPDADTLATVDLRTGRVDTRPAPGGPVDADDTGGALTLALRDARTVTTTKDGQTTTVPGFTSPHEILTTGEGKAVLDDHTTSLTALDPGSTDKGEALRAGEGATHAVTDRYQRILTTDTRGNELLAFSTDPLILKQRYPVPGAPYALAYDPQRDLAWITLTETNELVGYDIAGGEPVERHRFPTVRQPNAATVDPATGTVYVTSATGDGIQVVAL
ncbi:hypothetical protein GIY23_11245 [Allosaccharopolyspora coralli]|uniref:Lipoprotein n=1 Tax=Allosaccharopolyspora coralli TaxID=2665642 RepID=A0A5Q3QEZ0_9PSEU|nr:hypothetical protein [Allosaccharopolyspora coralli]QGK70019.1 hypothetical protein GIY23_11245 [Allosaccharopolyspora coralli]